jgi:hypothetical protein
MRDFGGVKGGLLKNGEEGIQEANQGEKNGKKQKLLELWQRSDIIVFMKLRISIIFFGAALLFTTGCSTVKTAYSGQEHSYFANPAKSTAANNPSALPPVAEAPAPAPGASANPGATGAGAMTGTSAPETWGGALSDR